MQLFTGEVDCYHYLVKISPRCLCFAQEGAMAFGNTVIEPPQVQASIPAQFTKYPATGQYNLHSMHKFTYPY